MSKPVPRPEPIAIVGIGCRLPGEIATPESFWRALCEELDVVGEVLPERWNIGAYHHPDRTRSGTTYTRSAAMLPGVDLFDAAFFGIAPQEASRIDPQHRLLLEVTWEALEDAGHPAASLKGQKVGVFVGQSFQDYLALQLRDPLSENAYTMMGGASCMAANRLSYFLDLRGPSVTLDTACASGLTSVHAACQSIANGESTLALCGATNVSLVPGGFVGFSRAQMLSPTGRCQAFSANADGYVRGEGAGIVVLKPLSSARRSGDRIYAVIRATGINHHGHSPGITFPGVDAQEELLRTVLDRADIRPHQIHYVEAHGTGTQAGDPVEATAIGRTLGQGRSPASLLRIGSAKTNFGHAEAAAGIVGLIKLALSLHHRFIPRSLHADTINPKIPFAELGLKVANQAEPWPDSADPARGMVSAFGFGGANACALLEAAPRFEASQTPTEGSPAQGPFLLPVSARSEEALRTLALSLIGRVRESECAPQDLCHTAALRRDHHNHRLALTFRDGADLASLLGAHLRGEEPPRVLSGRARARRPKVAFAFCGNGPQWWAMGRQLLVQEPVFRRTLLRCAEAFSAISDYDLFAELGASEAESRMARTDVAQPAIYALQLGLCELLARWGIRPDGVLGHSAGEGASAYIAGALSFEDAIKVIYHRCRTQQLTQGSGRLAAAGLSLAEAERFLAPFADRICVSAHNSPRQVTFSGELSALRKLGQAVQSSGAFWREIPMDYAFHSRAMDVVRDDLLQSLAGLAPLRPNIPFYSSVSGLHEPEACLGVDYWWRNLRQPVLFAPAIEALIRDGYEIVIEIGPHPVLRTYFAETASQMGAGLTILPTLRRKEDEAERILSTIGALYASGYPIDFSDRYSSGRMISLPAHPFLRERHWNEPAEAAHLGRAHLVHPLLGRRAESQRPEWRVALDPDLQTWVRDHVVGGSVVFPGAGYLEQSLGVAREVFGEGAVSVEHVEIEKALVLEAGAPAAVSVTFDPELHTFAVRSGEAGRTLHAKGELFLSQGLTPHSLNGAELRTRCNEHWDGAEFYQRLAQRGLHLGPAFQGVREVWRRDGEALAAIELPELLFEEGEAGRRCRFHPALLDACLQAIFATGLPGTVCYLPTALRRFVIRGSIPVRLLSHVLLHDHGDRGGRGLSAEVTIANTDGQILARIQEITLRPVDLGADRAEELVHELRWEPRPRANGSAVTKDSAEALARVAEGGAGHAREPLALYRERTLPAENALCSLYFAQALIRLGFRPQPAESFATSDLMDRLGIAPRYLRQIEGMLSFLVEDGVLGRGAASRWTVLGLLPEADLSARFREVWSNNPASHAQIELTHRVGMRLAEILRGEIDPLAEIFSEVNSATMEEIYDASPVQWYGNSAARAVLLHLLDGLPTGRRVDVLEIGAGTGGLSGWLLPLLAPDRGRYRFTDVSDAFLSAARARFGELPYVEYGTLDVEAPGEHRAPADMVVASNVLHATRDARETLTNIRRLVRPGGCALFVELSPGVRAIELVYGLLPGWWRVEDHAVRPASPLLPPAAWVTLAKECGFDEVALATNPDSGRVMSVVIARVAEEEGEVPLPAAQGGAWLVLPDRGGFGRQVAAALTQAGARVLGDLAAAGGALQGIVDLSALDLEASADPASGLEAAGELCLSTAHLLRTITGRSWESPPRLFLVTRGARAVASGERPSFVQASLWGLGRSVMLEHPALRCTLLDLDPAGSRDAREARKLAAELLLKGEVPLEQALALRGEERLVERLAQAPCEEPSIESHADATDRTLRLEVTRPGSLSGLALVETPRLLPGSGEVEIEVHASALNFRDVMLALDILPSRESPPLLGIECSGRITAVGAGVAGFRIGDEVMAISNGTFGRHVLAPSTALLRKPPGMSHTEAATVPSSFAAAVHALCHLGRMRAGERLLVHGAAGGLGLAAVQLAVRAGVQVYATAGTREKRELLSELGATRVMDSRALDFGEEILRATSGQGVDLVLNSLSGEALTRSLAVLKPLGRFLEVGKRDFFANSRLGWRLLQQRSFHAIDLDKVVAAAPQVLREIIEDLQRRLDAGELRPLPHRVFPLSRAAEAFRTMQRSRHVGKLVIETREPHVRVESRTVRTPIRRDGTYLITGGLGGLGLALAGWSGQAGAGRIVLVGRNEPGPEARRAIRQIADAGTRVRVERADISNRGELTRILDELRKEGPPLRGVFHAAMVLDDAILLHLTRERVDKVMGGKARGALFLHEETLRDPLDLFMCCSSLAGVLGNPGQAIYGAANTFLDALCQHRRALGLPALAVSFGAIRDVGFVARTEGLGAALEKRGMLSFPVNEALRMLGRLLGMSRAHVGLFRYDWSRYQPSDSSLVSHLIAQRAEEAMEGDKAPDDLRERLRAAGETDRQTLLHERLSWHISRILGLSSKRIDPDASIAAMGMDSLMAVDLHRFIEISLGADVPVMSLLQGVSIAQLAKEIGKKLVTTP